MEQLFRPNTSPIGSSKALTESLVLSRWSDYLQDIEHAEDSDITLSDILFFTTGCKVLPQHACHRRAFARRVVKVSHIEYMFKHPRLHYESFKADDTFGILNARGFGTA